MSKVMKLQHYPLKATGAEEVEVCGTMKLILIGYGVSYGLATTINVTAAPQDIRMGQSVKLYISLLLGIGLSVSEPGFKILYQKRGSTSMDSLKNLEGYPRLLHQQYTLHRNRQHQCSHFS